MLMVIKESSSRQFLFQNALRLLFLPSGRPISPTSVLLPCDASNSGQLLLWISRSSTSFIPQVQLENQQAPSIVRSCMCTDQQELHSQAQYHQLDSLHFLFFFPSRSVMGSEFLTNHCTSQNMQQNETTSSLKKPVEIIQLVKKVLDNETV